MLCVPAFPSTSIKSSANHQFPHLLFKKAWYLAGCRAISHSCVSIQFIFQQHCRMLQ